MTKSGNDNILSGKLLTTNGAVNYGVVVTVNGTGRINDVLLNSLSLGVTESGNDYVLSGKLLTTYSTVNYRVVVTVNGTGRINNVFLNSLSLGVTGSRYDLVYSGELYLTNRAVNYGVVVTVNGTGGINDVLLNSLSLGVTESIYDISNVAVTTAAEVGGIAFLSTVGRCYDILVVVLCDCINVAPVENLAVLSYCNDLEFVVNIFFAISCNLELLDYVVSTSRCSDLLATLVDNVLVSTVNCIPGNLDLATLLVRSINGIGHCAFDCGCFRL